MRWKQSHRMPVDIDPRELVAESQRSCIDWMVTGEARKQQGEWE